MNTFALVIGMPPVIESSLICNAKYLDSPTGMLVLDCRVITAPVVFATKDPEVLPIKLDAFTFPVTV
jgi:hypothetical protein